jgi:hypothetical protein
MMGARCPDDVQRAFHEGSPAERLVLLGSSRRAHRGRARARISLSAGDRLGGANEHRVTLVDARSMPFRRIDAGGDVLQPAPRLRVFDFVRQGARGARGRHGRVARVGGTCVGRGVGARPRVPQPRDRDAPEGARRARDQWPRLLGSVRANESRRTE